jgi:cellulose synthase/poly-beta-1,6-N-acetylglucosamine synthase-like glycosyltransferase
LVKRNSQEHTKYCFGDQDETIDFLFISCPFVKDLWRIIYMTFNILPPPNTISIFGNCLDQVAKKDKRHIRVGVCTLLWIIWNVMNDFIFSKSTFSTFQQAIPLSMHWIHTWSFLAPTDRGATWYRYGVQPFDNDSM